MILNLAGKVLLVFMHGRHPTSHSPETAAPQLVATKIATGRIAAQLYLLYTYVSHAQTRALTCCTRALADASLRTADKCPLILRD